MKTSSIVLIGLLSLSFCLTGCFGNLEPSVGAFVPFTGADDGTIDDVLTPAGDGLVEPPQENPIRPIDEPSVGQTADLSGDGVIDESDEAIFQAQFGLSSDDEGFEPAADFDGDGEVTLVDFQIFLRLLAGEDVE